MKIEGEITTGLGKAEYFMSQEFYTKEFKKNLGFIPYPGTLNIIVGEEYLPKISEIKNTCENLKYDADIIYKNCMSYSVTDILSYRHR